jgi:hypothetical protein
MFTVSTIANDGTVHEFNTDSLSVAYTYANGSTTSVDIYMDGDLIDRVTSNRHNDDFVDDLGILGMAIAMF